MSSTQSPKLKTHSNMSSTPQITDVPIDPAAEAVLLFHRKLYDLVHESGMWTLAHIEQNDYGQVTTFTFICPHGDLYAESITRWAMEGILDPEMLATMTFDRPFRSCKYEHNEEPLLAVPPEVHQSAWLNPYLDKMLTAQQPVSFFDFDNDDTFPKWADPQPFTYQNPDGTNAWNNYAGGVFGEITKLVPALKETQVQCPLCVKEPAKLVDMVIHLNDQHKRSRGWIADWLESLDVDLTIHVPDEFDY